MARAWLYIADRRDAEIETEVMRLMQPDTSEAANLAEHIDKCAARFRIIVLRGNKHSQQLGATNLMLAGLLLFVIFTNDRVLTAVKTVAAYIGS